MKVSLLLLATSLLVAAAGCSTMDSSSSSNADPNQLKFKTPEEAVAAFDQVAGQRDQRRVEEIFGAGSFDLLTSGDDVADAHRASDIKALIAEKVAFEDLDDETKVPLLGDDGWPFPVPLVKERGGWRFDTETGREEIENRRVGLNELLALDTLHAVVDAQREYYDGIGGRKGAYARRVISGKGKRDGLYWPPAKGVPESPLGPLVAEATIEGYSVVEGGEPRPYHGYYYRMLEAQGPNAPGGAKSYVDGKGSMSKGFAMVAWPARYGNSGRMTFLVGKQGIVFQKDLGENTEQLAKSMSAYDPDTSWEPTAD